jgi:hypothetical protein
MPSLDSLGQGLDGWVDEYLRAGSLEAAAATIRAHPLLLTPAAVRAVLAMTPSPAVEPLGRARLLYRAELHGLARALRDLDHPMLREPLGIDRELRLANERVRQSTSVVQAIEHLRPVPRLAGFADLNRGGRREVEHMLGDLLLIRYHDAPRREDLDDALVLLRRALSAQPTIGTAEALGEAEFETYRLTGERQRLIRAHHLVEGVLDQQDPSTERRPLTLVLFGRVQLAHFELEADPDALASALLSAELAADLAVDPIVAHDVIELARYVQEAARAAGERDVEASAGRVLRRVRHDGAHR